jgi:hypothetical protein
MKITSVIFLTLLFSSFSAFAQDVSKELFYESCMDKAITKFEGKSKNVDSDRAAVKRDACVASLKAEFIKSHKDQLLDQMCVRNLDMNQADVDYFLTKSFGDFMGDNLDQAVADLMKAEDSSKEVYEAYSEEKK